MENLTINEISIYSQNLIEFIGNKQVGELITYEELSEVIDFDVTQNKGRGYLNTARNRLLKDSGIVIGTIRKEGVKIMSDEEIAKTVGKRYLKALRSKGRKAYHQNTSVDYTDLSPEAKIDHQCTMTILALMQHVTKRKSINKIENKIKETHVEISEKDVLKMLRKPLMNGDE